MHLATRGIGAVVEEHEMRRPRREPCGSVGRKMLSAEAVQLVTLEEGACVRVCVGGTIPQIPPLTGFDPGRCGGRAVGLQPLGPSGMMPESLLQGGRCSFSPAPLDTQDTKRM